MSFTRSSRRSQIWVWSLTQFTVFRHEYLLEIVEELWLSVGKFATPQNVIVPNHSYTTMEQSFPTLPQTPLW